MLDRIKIYRRGLSVERLHTVPHILPYNNGFHSANAALIAMELAQKHNVGLVKVMKYMLLHDVAEFYVGDMPSDAKVNNPLLKEVLDAIEGGWEETNLPEFKNLSPLEKNICKCADLIELGMYCLDELDMGNLRMHYVLNNVYNYLYRQGLNETQVFIDLFYSNIDQSLTHYK